MPLENQLPNGIDLNYYHEVTLPRRSNTPQRPALYHRQDPRHQLPQDSSGKREQQIADAMPALELAGLPYGVRKAAQPPVTASNTKCATTGSGGETRQTCSEIELPRNPRVFAKETVAENGTR